MGKCSALTSSAALIWTKGWTMVLFPQMFDIKYSWISVLNHVSFYLRMYDKESNGNKFYSVLFSALFPSVLLHCFGKFTVLVTFSFCPHSVVSQSECILVLIGWIAALLEVMFGGEPGTFSYSKLRCFSCEQATWGLYSLEGIAQQQK